MTNLSGRLAKLEALRPHGRIVPIWAHGRDRGDIDAEIAELKRSGRMTNDDHLHLITWMDGDAQHH